VNDAVGILAEVAPPAPPVRHGPLGQMPGRWLRLFGVPHISARALGLFRTLLGAALFLIVLTHPIRAVPLEAQRVYSPLAAADWVRALAAGETATSAVHWLACISALSFAAGFFARPAYVVLVAALVLRTLFILLQAGAHDWGTPLITLLALVVVPWGASGRLIDAWRPGAVAVPHGAADPLERRLAYGFAVWLPGLTIGLAFAAAALEKLRQSGLGWVTHGAVRYHFVEDASNAPFEAGLWVATQPRLAVLLSLFGILVEGLFIAVIFVRGWQARAMFGLAAASLMAGFWVFQGIHWWPWLMLLAAFLPWARGVDAASGAGAPDLRLRHALVVALVIAGQVWASYRRVEIEPLFSHYPMYASTYESPEHYEHAHEQLLFRANGSDITDRIRAAGGGGVISRALESGKAARESHPEIRDSLIDLRNRYVSLYGEAPDAVEAFLFKRPFDWQAGRFTGEVIEPLGTVQLR
jgi:hypothetical protein